MIRSKTYKCKQEETSECHYGDNDILKIKPVKDPTETSEQPRMVSSETEVGFLRMSPLRTKNSKSNATTQDKKSLNVLISKQNQNAAESLSAVRSRSGSKVKVGDQMKSRIQEKTKRNTKPTTPRKNHVLTDYYPVRRSSRKTKSMIKEEMENEIINAVLSNSEDGIEVTEFPDKGRGVIANRLFNKGDFVVEYAGDLISWPEARTREAKYSQDAHIGCYMYYFSSKGKNFCIDATAESGRLGRLLNHSRRAPNCVTKLVWVPNQYDSLAPRLVIVAKRAVAKGEELTYDYGDRDKEAVEVYPWLKS